MYRQNRSLKIISASLIGIVNELAIVSTRTLITFTVTEEHLAKSLALISFGEAISETPRILVFEAIFKATRDSMVGFVLLMQSVLLIFPFLIFWLLHFTFERELHDQLRNKNIK